jgi:hypothetical protein
MLGCFRVIGIRDALKASHFRALDFVDRLVIDENCRVSNYERRAGVGDLREAADIDLVSHTTVMRADLPQKFNLATTERSARSKTPIPGAEETQQLPNAVDTQTTGLNGIAAKMAVEKPVIDRHVAFRNDSTPRTLTSDFENPIHHQHGWSRELQGEFGRRVVEEIPVRDAE